MTLGVWCLLYTELDPFWGQSSQGESFSWGLSPEEAVDRSVHHHCGVGGGGGVGRAGDDVDIASGTVSSVEGAGGSVGWVGNDYGRNLCPVLKDKRI